MSVYTIKSLLKLQRFDPIPCIARAPMIYRSFRNISPGCSRMRPNFSMRSCRGCSRRLPAPLIPRTNSKLFVDNVAECSNPNTFTQGCWSCPFPLSPVVQIGDDGDNGARTDDGGVVGQAAKILSAIWRISTAFLLHFFHGGETID